MANRTIDEVLEDLDEIIRETTEQNNYLGVFAYVYRRTTAQIKTEIEKGMFENNERLQAFDVLFAGYYIDAYKNYQQDKPVSESWKIAFDARHENLTLIQHLMMGMNAHINLDLAITASEIMRDKPIAELENDFNKVNDILAGLLNEMQTKIARVSFFMFLLDWIGKKTDEKVINFSMVQARTQAWRIANELWYLTGEEKEKRKLEVDQSIRKLSEFIKNPKSGVLKLVLKLIRWFEEKNIENIMKKIQQ